VNELIDESIDFTRNILFMCIFLNINISNPLDSFDMFLI